MPFDTDSDVSLVGAEHDLSDITQVTERNGDVTPILTTHSHSLTSPNGGSHNRYEEFFGGTIPCPSCRGAGRIARDEEHKLVALIPMSDKRLRPSRTVWYVLLAVIVCAIIGGLAAYFLFPRSVRMDNNSPILQPVHLYVNTTTETLNMTIINEYNVTNGNFYGVTVGNLEVTVTFDQHVIMKTQNVTELYVPLRTTRTHYIAINLTFSGDEGYIANYCGAHLHRSHSILMPFSATLKSSYFGGTFENTLTTYQHVRCTQQKHY